MRTRWLIRGTAAAGLGLLIGTALPAAAKPAGARAAPQARFRRDPDALPGVTLLPHKPLAQAPIPREALDRFDQWAGERARGAAASDGVALARARRAAMSALIETDPAEALRRAVRDDVRAGLPPAVAAELEQPVRGIGTLLVVCALPADTRQPVEIQREVIVNGRAYRAFTHGRRLEQTCARQTPVFGIALGDVLALEEKPYRQLDGDGARAAFAGEAGPVADALTGAPLDAASVAGAIDEGDQVAYFGSGTALNQYLADNWQPYIAEFGGGNGGPGAQSTWTQGRRRYVAYRARLAEDATNYEPYAFSSGLAAFNTVSNWFYEWSYGSSTMQFVVVTNVYVFTNSGAWYEANGGWPKLLADCRTASLGTPEAYTNFDFDSATHNWNVGTSGYAGVAYVGGRGASFHEGYGAIAGVVGHEHGHNLGLPHNNFWDTSGQSIFGPGAHSEYGDDYDIMGNGYANWPFAANMRNRLWWLPDMHTLYNVTSGVHRLQAMDQFPLFLPDTNAPQNCYALALPKDGRNYVFEFRQDTNRIGSNQSMLNGVFLEVDGGFGGGPELLDCTPGSSGGKSDAMLTIGRMFTDPNVNLHVTPIARGPTSTTNWIDLAVYRNTQISNHPPALVLSAGSYTTSVGVAVSLTATASDADGDALAYFWDFGDGTMSYDSSNVQAKSWSAAGVYLVRCVAADMHGREASAQLQVRVGSPATFSISGRVLSPSGEPVAGVRIASAGPTVYSDVAGNYLVPNLAAGTYSLTANGADAYGNNYTFSYSFANPVAVGPDQAGRDITAATATGTNIGAGTGFLYERWDNVAGTLVSDLTADPGYPNQPDDQRVMKALFEAPTDFKDYYGTRLRAVYTAPLAGTYYFYIASDDASELWFSSTTNPAAATKIAYVSSYTASRAWTTYASQKSAAIVLAAGQKCYIEALQKEGSGGDHLAVGADLPDGSQEKPIPYHRLDPWLAGFASPSTTVGIAATDATAAEPGADAGAFTLTRSGDSSAALDVTFQLTGTAQYDVDYLPTGLTATFAAGQTQAVVAVSPRDDTASEPVETVTATLIPGAAYAVGAAASATVSILDNEATTVVVTAPDATAAEAGGAGIFAITRNGQSTGTITVALAIAGTASNGVDFTALPSSVVIPAGSSTVALAVSPFADGITEIAETVTLTALGGAGYAVGSPSNATVTIAADPGAGTGILREWWTGLAGTAVSDLTGNSNYPAAPTGSQILTNLFECPVDWADSYGTRCRGYFSAPVSGAYYFYIASDDTSELWLGSNSLAASAVKVASVTDWTSSRQWTKYASQKSAAITLQAGQLYYIEALQKEGGGGDHLAVGVEYPGGYQELPIPYHRLFPYDTQKPTVSVVAQDPAAAETGDTGSVLVVRSSEAAVFPLAVALTYSGSAMYGVDYAAMPTQVLFAAGVTNAWLSVNPVHDTFVEGGETVLVSVVSDTAHFIVGTPAGATVGIADDYAPPAITLTSPTNSTVYIPAGVGLLLDATITDDGIPDPPGATTQGWSQVSGPAVAVLSTSNDWRNAAAQFPSNGTYVLRLTAGDGFAAASTSITVNVGTFAAPAWTNATVGTISVAPVFTAAGGTNRIASAGRPGVVGGTTTDNFAFAMIRVSGDCTITARVVSVQNVAGTNSFGGVMMRESLGANAKSASIGLRGSGRARFATRLTNGAVSATTTSGGGPVAPYWMRLDRTGNVFKAYYSSGGVSWTQLGSSTTIAMSNTIYVGLAAASGSNTLVGTSVFDRVGVAAGTILAGGNVGALVSAGGPVVAGVTAAATLAGGASDDGLPNPPAALTFAWAKVAGPGGVAFANAAATNTTATFDTLGSYTLRLVANDGQVRTFSDTTASVTGTGVRIVAADPYAATPGTNTGTFVLTRSGPTGASLAVNLVVGGTAAPGLDYLPLTTQAVIDAGASNVAVTVWPVDTLVPRDTVSVVVALAPGSGYGFDAPGAATVWIANTNLPVVSVTATDGGASEPPGAADPGIFTFTRTGGTNFALAIAYALGGTATNGVDYAALNGLATIPAGSTHVDVTVLPLDHAYGQAPLTVLASVVATDGTYAAGAPASAAIAITNRNFLQLHLLWQGVTNSAWDLGTTPNWFATELAASNIVFSNSCSVAFDDTPGVTTTVVITGSLLPNSVAVNASTNRYTFTGSGSIGSGARLLKDGTNSLIIATNLNYAGPVAISNGAVQVGTGGTVGSFGGAVQIGPAGTLLYFRGDQPMTITNPISGSGTLMLQGPGTIQQGAFLVGAGNPSFTGPVVVNNARLQGAPGNLGAASGIQLLESVTNGGQVYVASATSSVPLLIAGSGWWESAGRLGALRAESSTIASPITLAGNARIGAYATGSSTLSGAISGGYELEFWCGNGAQSFTVSPAAPNTYGSTRVSSSSIVIAGNSNAFSTGALVMNGGLLRLFGNSLAFASLAGTSGAIQNMGTNATAIFTIGAGNSNTAYAGSLSNGSSAPLGLTKVGTGTQTLSIAQSFTGPTTVHGGALLLTAPNAANSGLYASPITVDGGQLIAGGPNALQGSASAGATITLAAGGTMTTANGVTAHIRGLLVLAGGTLASGTPDPAGGSWILDTNVVAGGSATPSTISAQQVQLARSGGVTFDVAPGSTNGPDLLVSGTLTNASGAAGALVKSGGGTMALSGLNTYGGPTAISNGILLVNGTLGTGAVFVANGATLGGGGTLRGSVTNAGIVTPGVAAGIGVLTLSNAYTQAASGALAIELAGTNAAGVDFDLLQVGGPAALGGTLNVTLADGFTPAAGQSFTILTAGTRSGTFATTNLPPLGARQLWQVGYSPAAVTLSVVLSNAAPVISVPGPHLLPLGATTNFAVTATDPEGDATAVTNAALPAGASFQGGLFSWTATPASWNTTNAAFFVATDEYGAAATNSAILIVPYDADGDSLPDGWEWSHLGTLTNGPDGDVAGKGSTLVQDYIAGTDPTNRDAVFRAVAITGTPARVNMPTVSGRLYRIWFSDDAFVEAAHWSPFGNQANGIGSWMETNPPPASYSFSDDFGPNTSGHAPTNNVRCYRIGVQLAP